MSKCTISLLGITYIYNLRFTKKTMFFFLVAKRPFRARNRVLAAISLRQRRSNRGSPPPPPPSSFAEGSQSPPPSLLPPPPFLLSLYFLPPPSLSVFCSIQKRESFASTFFSAATATLLGEAAPSASIRTEESPEKHQVLLFFRPASEARHLQSSEHRPC